MNLRFLSVVSLLFFTGGIWGQQIEATGTVTDESGVPLPGVNITVEGQNEFGTLTDFDGNYGLNVEIGSTLVFSYIGFNDYSLVVEESGTDFNITMEESSESLEEVVVVGYGTVQKKDLTGSVASVRSKDFNQGVNTSPDQLIQGKVPGVRIISNTGQPGGSTTVSVRGNSSIRAGNDPLFVLDGVPLSGSSARPGGASGFGSDSGNPLDYLNPEDIESIDVLKDASATAIYGSRGANGVVIINTKKGVSGDPSIQISSSLGVSNVLRIPTVLNADEFRDALDFYTPDDAASNDFGGDVNAFNEIKRTAITQNHNAAISGGNNKGRYRISMGYLNQDGVLKGSNLTKYTISANSDYRFLESEKLRLSVDMFYTQTNERINAIDVDVGFEGNLVAQALNWNPTRPLRDENGNPTFVTPTVINPLTTLEAFSDKTKTNTFIANISPSYKFTDWLEYKLIYSLARQKGMRHGMYDQQMIDPTATEKGLAFIGNNDNFDYQVTQTLTFDKDIAEELHLNVVAGYEFLSYDTRYNFMSATGFDDRGLKFYDYMQYSPKSSRDISSERSPKNLLKSQFLRASFNYLDRYLLTGTIRRDGSTKFGEDNKYAYFPSLAFAWNISEEDFFQSEIMNNLKFRVGYGQTGNSEFPSGASRNRYIFGNQSTEQTNFGNPKLKWETSETYNAGIDFAFFNNRITGAVDVFRKTTEDALFERTIAQPAPSGKIWVNLDGQIENKGVEIELSGNVIQSADWSWDLGTNITFLSNKVSGLPGFYETARLRGQGFSGVTGQHMVSGQPLNAWYLAKWEGIDPDTGQSMYVSASDGHVGTDVDPASNKFYTHSPNPKTLLGITTSLSYKKFSLMANLNGAFGHYLFNNTYATVIGLTNLSGKNIAPGYFKPELNESVNNSATPSTRYLEKANYLKLSNVTLNYAIGDIGKDIKNAGVYITGQNLHVFTNYKGFDPELNTNGDVDGIPSLGIEYVPYPSARTVLLGFRFSL